MPILPPVDIAAYLAREKAKKEHPELTDDDIGIIFISPCPAKVSYIKNNFAGERNYIDAALSVRDVYFALLDIMKKQDGDPSDSTESGMIGIGWATTGGESSAIMNERYLAADGIENCIKVLDQIENEEMTSLDFVELERLQRRMRGRCYDSLEPVHRSGKAEGAEEVSPRLPEQTGKRMDTRQIL